MSFINITDPHKRDEIVKSFIATRKRIRKRDLEEKIGDLSQSEDRQKMFEPIIQSNIQAAEEIGKDLVPIRKELEHLNQELAIANIAQQQTILPPETPQRRRSLPSIPTPDRLGNLPADHLRQALSNKSQNDMVFGIYNKDKQLMIGSKPIKIDGNNIKIDGKQYQGSAGLWQLLTKKEPKEYTDLSS